MLAGEDGADWRNYGEGARAGGPCGSSLSVALTRSGLCVMFGSGDKDCDIASAWTTITVKRFKRGSVLTHEEVKAKSESETGRE